MSDDKLRRATEQDLREYSTRSLRGRQTLKEDLEDLEKITELQRDGCLWVSENRRFEIIVPPELKHKYKRRRSLPKIPEQPPVPEGAKVKVLIVPPRGPDAEKDNRDGAPAEGEPEPDLDFVVLPAPEEQREYNPPVIPAHRPLRDRDIDELDPRAENSDSDSELDGAGVHRGDKGDTPEDSDKDGTDSQEEGSEPEEEEAPEGHGPGAVVREVNELPGGADRVEAPGELPFEPVPNPFVLHDPNVPVPRIVVIPPDEEEVNMAEAALDHLRENDLRRENDDILSKQIGECNGATPATLRQWLQDIDLLREPHDNATQIRMARRMARGDLRVELEALLGRLAADANIVANERANQDWLVNVRPGLTKCFLSADEKEAMRTELTQIRQSSTEGIMAFNRRFRNIARVAYPLADRNADVHRILISEYGRALHSDKFAQKLANHEPPYNNIDAAMEAMETLAASRERYQQLGRGRQAAEVSLIKAAVKKETEGIQNDLAKVTREMSRLTNVLADQKGQKRQEKQAAAYSAQAGAQSGGRPDQRPPQARIRQGQRKKHRQNNGQNNNNGKAPTIIYQCPPPQQTAAAPRYSAPRGPFAGTCWQCYQPGHMARNCVNPPAQGPPPPQVAYMQQPPTAYPGMYPGQPYYVYPSN